MHLILWIRCTLKYIFLSLIPCRYYILVCLSSVRTHLFSKNSKEQHWKSHENMGAALKWLAFRLTSILPKRSISNFCPRQHCCLSHKSNTLRGNTQLFQYYLIYLRDEELKKSESKTEPGLQNMDRCKINSRQCTISFSSCEMDY